MRIDLPSSCRKAMVVVVAGRFSEIEKWVVEGQIRRATKDLEEPMARVGRDFLEAK